ncbi:hypothetical protein D3C73_1246020 [compost metagenome]
MLQHRPLELTAKRIHLVTQPGEFLEPAAGHIAVVNQPVPVLLGAGNRASPAEMDNRVRPSGNGLPGISADKARIRRAPHRHPAAWRPAQLLHNPEILSLDTARHIQ